MFDLSLLLFFCANPACDYVNKNPRHSFNALCTHIDDSCIIFYQKEGNSLLQWDEQIDSDEIHDKLRNRRHHLMKSTRNTEARRMDLYKNEYQTMLNNHCSLCFISGPLPGHDNHKLVGHCFSTDRQSYTCPACQQGENRHVEMIGNVREMLEDLGKATPRQHMAMVALNVENPVTHVKRVVIAPSHMQNTWYDIFSLPLVDHPLRLLT